MSETINQHLDRIDRAMNQLHQLHQQIRQEVSGRPMPHFIGPPSPLDNKPRWDLHIVFTEPVTGFDGSDIILLNGAAAVANSPNGYDYTAVIEHLVGYTGDFWVTVPENVCHDAEGNGNTAATYHIQIAA